MAAPSEPGRRASRTLALGTASLGLWLAAIAVGFAYFDLFRGYGPGTTIVLSLLLVMGVVFGIAGILAGRHELRHRDQYGSRAGAGLWVAVLGTLLSLMLLLLGAFGS